MTEEENLGSFFKENKKLVKDYLDTRLEIFKLKLIRLSSKSAGSLIWAILSMFLLFLLMAFIGLVTGFWLSDLTGSYARGFGLTTLAILMIILLLAVFRKTLFINPIIRRIINSSANENEDQNLDN